ncbi:MAG: hypothetical protein O7B81_06830 [Gammaproteobacteria bacterium]|nr:hypothetical protein [Gammaproteobacteria bacterium]
MKTPASHRRKQNIKAIVKRSADRRANQIREFKLSEAQKSNLSKEQQYILQYLIQEWENMQNWYASELPESGEKRELFDADAKKFSRQVGRAIRADLKWHPIVQEWLTKLKLFGDREALGQWKDLGLDTGVKRQNSAQEFWIEFHAFPLLDKGESIDATRRNLINGLNSREPDAFFGLSKSDLVQLRGRLRTRQNFHKLLKRLRIRGNLSTI